MCRRGQVELIRSDNGTNLVGAERELRAAIGWTMMDQTKINSTLASKGIRWIFNPPAWPHFGGVWERQVRLVKKILKSILGEQTMDDKCLQTVLCEVEAIINDRPITTTGPGDIETLTPNNLLPLKSYCSPLVSSVKMIATHEDCGRKPSIWPIYLTLVQL